MNTFFYLIIFIIGTVFGSFFTLAVYRIPKGEDIIYKHSYCPNCGHRLGFFEMIPVISYLALGGKCVHCGINIRIRYLVLEILSGITYLLLVLSLKVNISNLSYDMLLILTFYITHFACLFIIAGIDKENRNIQKSVLFFDTIVGILYMIYVCITRKAVVYTYIIILATIAILLLIDTFLLKKKLTENYTISILILSMIMMTFSIGDIFYYTVALFLILVGIVLLLNRIKELDKNKAVIKTKEEALNIPIGFYLIISNVIITLISNWIS